MNRYVFGVLGLIVLLGGGVTALFAIQNSSRTVNLSLDLWVAAWQLQDPVSVPVLIAVSALSGAIVVGLPLLLRSWRLGSRVRSLQQQVDLADGASSEWR